MIKAWQDSATLQGAMLVPSSPGNAPDSLMGSESLAEAKAMPSRADTALPQAFFETPYSRNMLLKPRIESSDQWIFGVIMLALIILAILNILYRSELFSLLTAPFRRKIMLKLHADESAFLKRTLFWLSLSYLLLLSVFVYQQLSYWGIDIPDFQGWQKYTFLLLFLSALFFGKHLLHGVIGYVFDIGSITSLTNFGALLNHAFLGLTLLPICLAVSLAPLGLVHYFIWMGLIIFIAFLLFRNISLFFLSGMQAGLSLFHMFLYFCSLEILPVLIWVKVLILIF